MISVQQVSKAFGQVQALENISFEIQTGEVVGFLGPNGAGKTTLMRLIAGFFPPSSGKVMMDGTDLCKSKPHLRRKIGYLPENNPLYRDMTAKDFLSYVAQLKGIPFRGRKTAIQKVAVQCGLEAVLNRIAGKLSKGFQQRLGLAQALLGDPELLILDEPTNGLDPKQIVDMRNLIQILRRERTIILSTHILSEVQMTCERVLILNEGKLAAALELKSAQNNLEEIFLKVVSKESELCQK